MYISYNNSKIIEKVELKTIEQENFDILNSFKIMLLDYDQNIKINNIELLNIKNIPQNEFHYFIYKYNNIINIIIL